MKTELKNVQGSSHTNALIKGNILAKNATFLQKKCCYHPN